MGRFSIRPFGRSSICPSVPPPGPSSQAWLAGPQAWLVGPQAWLAGPQAWLAGPQAWLAGWASGLTGWASGLASWLGLRPDWLGLRPGWMSQGGGRTYGQTDGKSPHSTGLRPLSGPLPKSPAAHFGH